MKMTVGLALSYVCGCADCAREVENTIAAAIRDRTVTGVRLSVAPRCDHESAEQLSARLKQPIQQGTLQAMVDSAPGAGLGDPGVTTPPPSAASRRGGEPREGGGESLETLLAAPDPLNGFDTGGVV